MAATIGLTLIGIIASFGIAAFFYLLASERRGISMFTRSDAIISSSRSIPDINLKVTVDSRPVSSLIFKRYTIWNSGNRTIDGDDLRTADPLKISLASGQLLNADIEFETRSVNRVRLTNKRDAIQINFDYLDPKDGFIVVIAYDSEVSPEFSGQVKAIPNGVKNLTGSRLPSQNYETFLLGTALGTILLTSCLLPLFTGKENLGLTSNSEGLGFWSIPTLMVSVGAMYILFSAFKALYNARSLNLNRELLTRSLS